MTWDGADIYYGSEKLMGEHKLQGATDIFFTKYVPRPGKLTKDIVAQAIEIALQKMKTDSLHLIQYHWYILKICN